MADGHGIPSQEHPTEVHDTLTLPLAGNENIPPSSQQVDSQAPNSGDVELVSDMDNLATNDDSANSWTVEQKEQAALIRTQVEYYFSDQNLISDCFLRSKLKAGYGKNKPIPIEKIHSFNRMRNFQPYSFVVEVIKTCPSLQVVQYKDKDSILRKKPFIKEEHVDPAAPKVLSNKKATGFEEYYTDPPMTPQEAEEEEDMYSQDKDFTERMETALHAFRAKRTFHARNADIWTKFVKFGGVTTGPNPYTGGVGDDDDEEMSKAEKLRRTATEWLESDKFDYGPSGKWAVDFNGVARGFLSSIVSEYYAVSSSAQMTQITNILRNFYNYILHHNVCPEYKDDIMAARRTCDQANDELPGICKVLNNFPGDFNTACLVLFGDQSESAAEIAGSTWAAGTDIDDPRPSKERSKQIFKLAAAAQAPDSWWTNDRTTMRQDVIANQPLLDSEYYAGLQVLEIIYADDEVREMYQPYHGFKPVGKLVCKPWQPPHITYSEDLPKDYVSATRPQSYELWLEEDLLKNCFVGTRFIATVHKLGSGLHVIEGVANAYPSFYTVLLNELLYAPGSSKKWREPIEVTREEHLWREGRYEVKDTADGSQQQEAGGDGVFDGSQPLVTASERDREESREVSAGPVT